jgi:predicted nucleic acid-binding protein
MTAVIDAGILYALVDAADTSHDTAVRALEAEAEAIVVPQVILPEICYLIGSRLGAEQETAFVRYLVDSDWRLEPLTDADLARAIALMSEHATAAIGFVHAAVAAVAERMAAGRIYTLNRTQYERIRPVHVEHFELLPRLAAAGA